VPGFRASRLSATMSTIPEVEIQLPASAERLVWFVDHWSPATVRPEGLIEIEIPHGRYLYVLPLGNKAIDSEDYAFVRAQPPRRAAGAARVRPQCPARDPRSLARRRSRSRRGPAAARALRHARVADRRGGGVSARRFVDPPALRPQPRGRRRLLLQPRDTGRRVDGAAVDAPARRRRVRRRSLARDGEGDRHRRDGRRSTRHAPRGARLGG